MPQGLNGPLAAFARVLDAAPASPMRTFVAEAAHFYRLQLTLWRTKAAVSTASLNDPAFEIKDATETWFGRSDLMEMSNLRVSRQAR